MTRMLFLLLMIPCMFLCGAALAEEKASEQKSDPALERTRKTVRMLDDIYKGGIVAITANYVNDKDTIPAGTAFKQVFKSAAEKGWHEVRLVDGLGEPLNDENAPKDAFEKKALKVVGCRQDEVVRAGG